MRKYTSSNLYEKIRSDFLKGKFKYGEAITELGLSERYNTSRTPLREALIQLEKDGLIERKTNGRITILTMTEGNLKEILDLRLFLEVLILESAMKEGNKENLLTNLKNNLDLVDMLLAAGEKDKARTELANFHLIPHQYASLKYTIQIIRNYNFLIYPLRSESLLYTSRLVEAQKEHKKMYALLKEEDFNAVRDYYRNHLYISISHMMKRLAELQEN